MPRRVRTRDFDHDEADSDMYDMERERERERDPYRRASRPERSHHYDKAHHDYARRHSIPPPLEKMERLRVQDRDLSPPRPNEYFRDDFDMDSRRFPPRLSGDEADADVPPDEPLHGFARRPVSPPSRGSGSGSGRRRRPPPPRVVVPDEEVLPRSASDGRLVDSDSDAEVYHRRRRSESIRSHNEVPPRHRRPRKVELDDPGDVYSGEEAISSDYRRPRGGSHRYRGSAPRPRAGYDPDIGEESSDAMFRKPRRKMDHVRPGYVPADRDLSSPESEDSADLPTAPVPPMHPGPGRGQRLRVPEAFSPLRPPRAPSPEVSFEAPRLKLRKDRDERKRGIPIDPRDIEPRDINPRDINRRDIDPRGIDPRDIDPREIHPRGIDPRDIDPRDIDPRGIDPRDIDPRDLDPRMPMDIPPPMGPPSPEPPGWGMKDPIPPARSRAHSLDKKIGPETMIREIRPDGSSVLQGEEIPEDARDDHPLADSMPRDAADRWAIVNAVPRSKSSTRDSTPSQEAPHSHPRERKTKFTAGEERPSDDDANFDRARVARRYVGMKKKERLWTEITKDLVVKEAIERAGYEYEETVSSYFVFSYLQYEDVSALVELSEDIRLARRRRIQELDRRRASVPSPRSLHDEPVMRPPSPRRRHRDGRRARERDYIDDSRERARSGRR